VKGNAKSAIQAFTYLTCLAAMLAAAFTGNAYLFPFILGAWAISSVMIAISWRK
jgi:hypothetical protein